MHTLVRILRSRRTAAILLGLFLAVGLVSAYVPQVSTSSDAELEAWRAGHRAIVPVVDALQLHGPFSSPWFLALLAFAILAMASVTWRQGKAAWRLTRGDTAPPPLSVLPGGPAAAEAAARQAGYLPLRTASPRTRRWVRNPWGIWGGVVLHAGMLLGLAALLVVGATKSVGRVRLVEGERFERRGHFDAVATGPLVKELTLDSPIALEDVSDSYWPSGDLRQVTLRVVESAPRSDVVREARIGAPLRLQGGETLYASRSFGEAFFVDFAEKGDPVAALRLEIERPDRGVTAYEDFHDTGLPYVVRAKYEVADPARFDPASAALVLRLDGDGGEVARAELKPGSTAALGPYEVRLAEVRPWVFVTVVEQTGIPVLFASFFVIFAGGLLLYAAPERELWLVEQDGRWEAGWRAARFGSAFEGERDRLVGAARGGEGPGC